MHPRKNVINFFFFPFVYVFLNLFFSWGGGWCLFVCLFFDCYFLFVFVLCVCCCCCVFFCFFLGGGSEQECRKKCNKPKSGDVPMG